MAGKKQKVVGYTLRISADLYARVQREAERRTKAGVHTSNSQVLQGAIATGIEAFEKRRKAAN
jgi:hypothetical protein